MTTEVYSKAEVDALLASIVVPPPQAPSLIGLPLRLERYGAALDGETPDDAAFAAAVQDAKDRTWNTCRIQWNGKLTLTQTPPDLYRVHLEGDDKFGATVCKKYSGSWLFRFRGPPGYSGGGLHNFAVPMQEGFNNGYLILARAETNGYSPDGIILEHLYLASGASAATAPFRNIELDGTARLSPAGIRSAIIQDVTCFGATGGNVMIRGVARPDIYGLSTYYFGTGSGTDADVYLRGIAAVPTQDARMVGADIEGALRMSDLHYARADGSFASINWEAATCSHVTVAPYTVGTQETGARPPTCRVI